MKQPNHHIFTLFPIVAISCMILLSLCVLRSYQKTSIMQPKIIIPAGATYLGK